MNEITFEQLPKAVSQLFSKLENIERLLLEKGKENLQETEQLLTIQEAGKFLILSVPTLYGYVHRSEIPVCKRGKRLYFSKQELTKWVKEGKKKTYTEIANEAEQYLSKKKRG